MKAAGAQAMRLLLRAHRARPAVGARVPAVRFLDPARPAQCTLVPPMQPVMDERARRSRERRRRGTRLLLRLSLRRFRRLRRGARGLRRHAGAGRRRRRCVRRATSPRARRRSRLDVLPAAEAVARGDAPRATARRPVVIADTQDNPGGGGHGDTTGLLAELVRQGAQGAVLVPDQRRRERRRLPRGGRGRDGWRCRSAASRTACRSPVERARAEADGRKVRRCTGPMAKGNPANLGPSALIEVAPACASIVVSRKMQALDQAMFRHVGIEPARLQDPGAEILGAFPRRFPADRGDGDRGRGTGPGGRPTPAVLPFRHLRKGLRLRPMDNTTSYIIINSISLSPGSRATSRAPASIKPTALGP